MQRTTLLTCFVLIASAGCDNGVSLGGATDGGNDGGTDGTQPSSGDAASPEGSSAHDARSPIDAPEESPPNNPAPNGCGGVCSGMTMPSTPVTSIAMLHGSWPMCGGALPMAAPNLGGFPADTNGLEIDGATGTAYVLVTGDGGALTRGVGPQYVWSATLDYPAMSGDPNVIDLNLTNTFSNSELVFTVTYFPAADGCTAAMHLVNDTSGSPPSEINEPSDFLLSGRSPLCTQCGPVCVFPECGGCSSVPPASATRSVSLSLTGVSFDGASAGGWQALGFNLDGKCSTAASREVCTLSAGSNPRTQTDGTGGIDNSFGDNVCPILDSLTNASACSSSISNVYVETDASGTGTMGIPIGNSWLEFPIRDAFIAQSGSGAGVFGAVAPTTSGFIEGMYAVRGQFSVSLCENSRFQTISNQIEQASDILSAGADDPGVPCDAISIGMTFTGSAPFSGPLPVVSSGCVTDAGSD